MNFKQKMTVILGVSLFLCLGSYFIITNIFEKMEQHLLEKCRLEAQIGAKAVSRMMDLMITGRLITEKNLFDFSYTKIPGSEPAKYTTPYDEILDNYIQAFQDKFLHLDHDLVYSVLVDQNGYVPTHNKAFSQPASSDTAYNLKHSRSKRKFDDTVGLKAARFQGPGTMEQFYARDTGEFIWDISAPVTVFDKHWGAFRVGVSLKRIEELKSNMLLLIFMIIFIIVSLTLLMLFMIIPRKLFDTDLISKKY